MFLHQICEKIYIVYILLGSALDSVPRSAFNSMPADGAKGFFLCTQYCATLSSHFRETKSICYVCS